LMLLLIGGLFSELLSGLLRRLFGRLLGGGSVGSSCPAVPFSEVGHKFWNRFRRLKVNHACQNCDGTGAVIYSAPGSERWNAKTRRRVSLESTAWHVRAITNRLSPGGAGRAAG
ncbi:MAG: hypothetical protein ACK5Q5_12605, partial [Planctomycetaceae bacterium]